MKYLETFFVFVVILVLGSASNLSDDSKIINGYIAPRYRYPFVVSFQYLGEHFCGCTIIREQWLLTAAHCVDEVSSFPLTNLRIVAGMITLGDVSSYVQTSKVLRMYKHPSYAGGISPHDVGLVRIETPLKWTLDVQAVFLPYPDDEYAGLTEMTGWGSLRPGFPAASTRLQYAQGNIISLTNCDALVRRCNGTVGINHICTVGLRLVNESSSKGDSGGPLILYNVNGIAIQIGIMAWNVSPCTIIANGPSVSTKLSKYIDWIICRINNDYWSPTAPCW